MSSTTTLPEQQSSSQRGSRTAPAENSISKYLWWVLEAAASLKLTVALLVYATFVVWIGTLAQTEADIWQVVDTYFHSIIMPVDFHFLLMIPKMAFPNLPIPELGQFVIPMPGGWIVGMLMIINLTAAHGIRFKVQTKGIELLTGLVVTAVGIVLTTLVVMLGNLAGGFQSLPWFSWSVVWYTLVLVSIIAWAAGAFYLGKWLVDKNASFTSTQWFFAGIWIGAEVLLPATLVYCAVAGVSLGNESLRILWQLLQGGFASIVLLVGCWLAFRKRAGVVLLHAGIGLMMLNELLVGRYAVEWQVFLPEGESANYFRDIRTTELAIITPKKDAEEDLVSVIPREILQQNLQVNKGLLEQKKEPQPIADPENLLPFDVAVVDYYNNADVRDVKPSEKTLATAGRGLRETIVPLDAAKGTDSDSSVDMAAAYVKILEKKTGKDLGTYMLSQFASEQANAERFAERVKTGDDEHQLFIRFRRAYQPYTVTLENVSKDDYLGSDTPRNYSSDIILRDPKLGVDEKVHIKMNDPLRYAGVTFYQSGYSKVMQGGKPTEATTLAVVYNRGWMIPYVACMIVATGMLAHFLIALGRFLARDIMPDVPVLATPVAPTLFASTKGKQKPKQREQELPAIAPTRQRDWPTIILCASVAVMFFAFIGSITRTKKPAADQFDLVSFGELPMAHRGRVKPLDTYARNTLRTLSMREQIKDKDGNTISATRWFLDTVTGADAALEYKIFRIEDFEILKLFGIKREKGNLYSAVQLRDNIGEFQKQSEAARKIKVDDRTPYQVNLLQLDQRLQAYMVMIRSFTPPNLPPFPSPELVRTDRQEAVRQFQNFQLAVSEQTELLKEMQPPLAIALTPSKDLDDKGRWTNYPEAFINSFFESQLTGKEPDAAVLQFETMLDSYRSGDVSKFNAALLQYKGGLSSKPPVDYKPAQTSFEAYFNQVSPFFYGWLVYLVVFVIALAAILFQSRALNSAAFTLLVLMFVLHTVSLLARIYISGRPPVTNLYSSAIFIGWGAVMFGIAIEMIYKIGVGNLVAAIMGYSTLQIAYQLAAGGDTIEVLQAVLDTQFWLATHVVCITLGYVATFVAGVIGVIYVVFGLATPVLQKDTRKDLGRMMYGVTCFAIFFSFVGTVLGGLWADDSWGRFWGWDPKENGALMIVLWNAVVLHARWDKMIADRGLAVVSILGNVVTAWSWFGVNELGVGLHSYGFTDGTMFRLVLFAISQFVLAALGCLPMHLWYSVAAENAPPAKSFSKA